MNVGKCRSATAALLVAQALWAAPASAAGAVAIGISPAGAQDGFSFGIRYDQPTETAARDAALSGCRTTKQSNDRAHARCKVIETFVNQCASVAMDPKDGTPGVGWAVAADSATAKRRSLANCEATAGPGRAGTCKVTSTHCDGAAK